MLQSRHLDSLTPSELEKRVNIASEIELDSGAAWRLSRIASRLEQLVSLRVLPGPEHSLNALDFGCGTGFLVSYLAHRFGWRAIGYEPYSTPAFAQGKVLVDWESVVKKGPYRLIVASEVFEHFTHPRDDLTRIRDVLAKDSAFLYATTGLYIAGTTDSNWKYLAPQSGHHVAFYARRSIQQIGRLMGASGVYQIGADYEWLFVFGEGSTGWLRKGNIALASALLSLGTRLGIISAIE